MSAATTRIYRGRELLPALEPDDRGFAYGDGVFTTMRVYRGVGVWFDAHLQRLQDGAARLGFTAPDPDWLRAQTAALLAAAAAAGPAWAALVRAAGVQGIDGVLKIVLTRGSGGRGYAPPRAAAATTLLALHPLPPPLPAQLALRWCKTRVARQPALAGIKHLNRLEQVLARDEWNDPDVHEGLMLADDGHVAGATAANVFALIDGRWRTPPVHERGIAGVARRWLLAQADALEEELQPARVESADAVFLCNAVRGILPAGSLGGRRWAMHPALDDLRRRLGRCEPAFA